MSTNPAAETTAPRTGRRYLESARYGRLRSIVLGLLSLAVIAVLIAWPNITNFYSYNDAYYNGVVASAAISAILTISLNLSMGYGGLLSMMHTGLQLLGGYAVATVALRMGLHWGLGVLAAILMGVLFSVLVISISLRATYLYFGMITLAADLILVEVGRSWDAVTGGVVGISGIYPTQGGEVMQKTTFYYIVLAALVVVYVVQRNVVRSGAGRAAMAVRESSDTASAMGIWPARSKVTVFAIAGGIGGLAGALYSLQLGFVNPDIGLLDNGLIFFVGLFLGGIATLVGPLLGVATITLIMESIKDYARYTTLILGLVLLASMMVIPRGMVGSWNQSRLGRDILDEDDDLGVIGEVPDSVSVVTAPENGAPALEGKGLVKHFGGVKAVDGIDLHLMPETIHGIIGPNGSGKSTLVSCLTRYHRLDDGEVMIGGQAAPRSPHQVAAAGVTRVFQIPHLFERVSVLDNVLTGMRMRESYTWAGAVVRSPAFRRQDREHRAEARELLRFAGLGSRAEWSAAALSHGQKRLLEVVRAVATQPRVLILDEPATGLTSSELVALADLCRALRDRGIAVLLIEHNIEFVMGLCSEITVIESGRVIERGSPEMVRNSQAVIEAYLGRPDLVEEAVEEAREDAVMRENAEEKP
ncbi:ABC transporter permease subunit [Ornithinimicrobium faecis]|uniref:branched-chain amino acid ABC transporter ATP-binding protein/permease n=1 Tax=Ornithinimicrobium faecis TaxID=2934158 RepID=UPI00211977D3|nr:branched-chain amino acid ABC transporter ATP-binding protein/permease [Ornithinimicrobium sp. HY1745]